MVEGDQELFSTLMRIFYTECGHKDAFIPILTT